MKFLSQAVQSLLTVGLIVGTTSCNTTKRTRRKPFEKSDDSSLVWKSARDTMGYEVEESTSTTTTTQTAVVANRSTTPVKEPVAMANVEEPVENALTVETPEITPIVSETQIKEESVAEITDETLVAADSAVAQDSDVVIETTIPAVEEPEQVGGVLTDYSPNIFLKGRLRSIGSDTMDDVMKNWSVGFKSFHSKLHFFHEGKGSSTAIPALLEKRADISPMSRLLKFEEITAFRKKYGYEPTQIPVAIDCIGIFVHPDNPIAEQGLSISQLDRIFSTTVRRSGHTPVITWGQLGLTGEWADKPLRVLGRNSASGTHSVFKEKVLLNGSFRPDMAKKASSREIIREISGDKYAIGYSAIGCKKSDVKALAISAEDEGIKYMPEYDNAQAEKYPLTRYLYLTLNLSKTNLKSLHKEFINYVFSKEGQRIVEQNGFFPIDQAIIDKWLSRVGR